MTRRTALLKPALVGRVPRLSAAIPSPVAPAGRRSRVTEVMAHPERPPPPVPSPPTDTSLLRRALTEPLPRLSFEAVDALRQGPPAPTPQLRPRPQPPAAPPAADALPPHWASLPRAQLPTVASLSRASLQVAERPAVLAAVEAGLLAASQALEAQLGGGVTLEAGAVAPAPAVRLAAHAVFVELAAGGQPAWLEVDALATSRLLALAAGSPLVPHLALRLTRAEEAALGWLSLVALAAWRKTDGLQGLDARFVGLRLGPPPALAACAGGWHAVPLRLCWPDAPLPGGLRLLVPGVVLSAWAQRTPPAPPEPPRHLPERLSAAEVSFVVRLGRTPLLPAELSRLSVADVLLLKDVASLPPRLHAEARLLGGALELTGAFGPEGFTVRSSVPRPTPLPLEPPVSDEVNLPVEVEVELTRLRLPLWQLAAVKVGSVLPLHVGPSPAVTLKVGDRTVARAELVDIEGEVGARIVSLP